MRLVTEIIELLSSDKPNLQNALFKAQVLAHKLGEAELRQWVDWELKGYHPQAELPTYRVLHVTVVGNVSNGGYRYTDQPLPLYHLSDELRDRLQVIRLFQSIAAIEQWARDDSDLSVVIPPELYPALSQGLSNGFAVERAWRKNSIGAMLQLVVEVRSRLLEFALRVGDKIPLEVAPEEMKQLSKEQAVSEIFRNSVFGNNTTIVVGSGAIHGVSNSFSQNDFAALSQALKTYSVAENDISALRKAIEEDKNAINVQHGTFGPAVRSWIGSMVSKAGSAAWNVSIGAAGNILGAALSAYYGFST